MIKVVRKGTVDFESIEDGTLFFAVYSQDGSGNTDYETVFQKIPLVNEKGCDAPTPTDNLNAVVTIGEETGNLCRFEPYEGVIPIYNAKLVIEE